LRSAVTLAGITPTGATEVIAAAPDGSVEPLLWVQSWRPEWRRVFLYRAPRRLPAGTRVVVSGAAVRLFPAAARYGSGLTATTRRRR
jgi:hypothetical protein